MSRKLTLDRITLNTMRAGIKSLRLQIAELPKFSLARRELEKELDLRLRRMKQYKKDPCGKSEGITASVKEY
ncbi:MAG: hypothetical protein PHU63_03970 [Candidatus ainarchaeum sp.]|nr:hypothetical protein [Candidatus ainarchaeum sp.]